MKTTVIATFRIEGIHHWPQAQAREPVVEFLAHPHRHVFHIRVEKEVIMDNREVEIILLGREVEACLIGKYWSDTLRLCDFGAASCETLAREMLTANKLSLVEVMEDGENGARITEE